MSLLADLMGDALDPPAEAVSLRKMVQDGEPHPTDWLVEAYFPESPDMEAIYRLFTLIQEEEDLPPWMIANLEELPDDDWVCLLYTSPSPRDQRGSRMPSSA